MSTPRPQMPYMSGSKAGASPVQPPRDAAVLSAVAAEMARQVELWGVQAHPDGTGSPHSGLVAEFAKARCDVATVDGSLTWQHILVEEVAEALAETDPAALAEESVQVAAVALSWARAIAARA